MPKAAQATVTLKHLAAVLAEQHEMAKKQSEEILNDAIGLVTKHLKKGDRIRIAASAFCRSGSAPPGWDGTLQPVRRSKSRRARKVAFRAAKDLKEAV